MELVGRESSWNPSAKNPTSTAYGLFQFLDTTRANYSKRYPQYNYMRSPYDQTMLGIQYVRDRYGDPVKALQFWDKNKWY